MTDPDEGAAPPREPAAVDEAERLVADTEVHAGAWEETLETLRELKARFEADGWRTIATIAGHTGPVAPVHGKGYWGLSHVVPDPDAERIGAAVEDREFPRYDVLRNLVRGRVFMVVTCLDPASETAILVASNYELRRATELVTHARGVDTVNTIVRHLDGTVVAEIRHEEPRKFFPRYEEFETLAAERPDESGVDDG